MAQEGLVLTEAQVQALERADRERARRVREQVDDQQLSAAEITDALAQPAFPIGAGQAVNDIGERGEVDAAAGAHGLDAKGDGEMTFAGAWLADEMNDFMSVDEVECCKGGDAIAVERRLEGEVEAGQRLDRGQPGHLQRRLDAPTLADRQLLGEQRFDRLDGAELAAFDALHQMIEHLEGAWHAQGDEMLADLLDRGGRQGIGLHGCGPVVASRWATAS